MASKVSGSFDAAEQTSDYVNGTKVLDNKRAGGISHLSLSGDFVGRVDLEIRWNDEADQPWHISDSFSAPTQGQFFAADNADYRLRCAELTSGTVQYRMGA